MWRANAVATIAGSLRNTPQPQAPRTRSRHPCNGSQGQDILGAAQERLLKQGKFLGGIGRNGPGVWRGTGDERRLNRLSQEVAVVITEDRAVGRYDHRVGVQAGPRRLVTLVIVRGLKQRSVQCRTTSEGLFLGLAAAEKAASRVLRRGEVERRDRSVRFGQQAGNARERGFVSDFDDRLDGLGCRRQDRLPHLVQSPPAGRIEWLPGKTRRVGRFRPFDRQQGCTGLASRSRPSAGQWLFSLNASWQSSELSSLLYVRKVITYEDQLAGFVVPPVDRAKDRLVVWAWHQPWTGRRAASERRSATTLTGSVREEPGRAGPCR